MRKRLIDPRELNSEQAAGVPNDLRL